MRCVFVASGAFLGRIYGETRCGFWTDEPSEHDFDQDRLITIDLAMTPNAAIAGRISWDAVQVDDCFTASGGNLGGTTLGPRWPELQLYGVVFLEQAFWKQLSDELRPPCPPRGMGGRDYEHTTVLYWPRIDDPRVGKRYMGHHAEILDERGTVVRVKVYPPGTSDSSHAQPIKVWIDLADPDQCDVGPSSLTQVAPGEGPKQGALYLVAGSLDAE